MTVFALLFGSKSTFATPAAFVPLTLLSAVALYCTAWTIWLSVPHTAAGWSDIGALLKQSGFRVRFSLLVVRELD
jgi:chitin synthase